jgi:hypothetical protein
MVVQAVAQVDHQVFQDLSELVTQVVILHQKVIMAVLFQQAVMVLAVAVVQVLLALMVLLLKQAQVEREQPQVVLAQVLLAQAVEAVEVIAA